MNEPLKINPKFEQIIPPLTADEFAQLEENILKIGRITDPIQVWRGVIIDGHHRHKILQKHPEIEYSTCEMPFECEAEAIAWICCAQLGRRNINEMQRDYLLGKRYSAEKDIRGGARSKEAEKAKGQNDPLNKPHVNTSHVTLARIAQDNNISESTVRRAEYLANGIDAAEEEHPGIKEMIFTGNIAPSKSEVCRIARLPKEERKKAVELLIAPKDESSKSKEIARQIEESFANGTEQEIEEEVPQEKEVIVLIPESAPTPKPAETEKKDSETKEHEIEESILNSMIGAVNMFIDSINNYLSRFPRLRTDPKYRSQTREIMVAARDYINDVEGDLL